MEEGDREEPDDDNYPGRTAPVHSKGRPCCSIHVRVRVRVNCMYFLSSLWAPGTRGRQSRARCLIPFLSAHRVVQVPSVEGSPADQRITQPQVGHDLRLHPGCGGGRKGHDGDLHENTTIEAWHGTKRAHADNILIVINQHGQFG